MAEKRTIGQIVDEVADKYFASGMDAYSAGVKACLDVARVQIQILDELPKSLQKLLDGMVKKDD